MAGYCILRRRGLMYSGVNRNSLPPRREKQLRGEVSVQMKKHSFTLVELLVVIGIIAILAGLILAGVSMARASAKATKCQHNQEQTMKLVSQAMSGNKDFLVSGDDFSATPDKKAAWTRYLYGEGGDTSGSMKGKTAHISDMEVLRCPTFKYDSSKALGAMSASDREKELAEAFGMVYRTAAETDAKFAGFDFRGTKFLKLSSYQISPNQLMLGGCAAKNERPYNTAKALLYSGSWDNKLVKVHGDKCNVFFLDGHVEGLAKAELEERYLPSASANEPVKFSDGFIDPDK